MPGKPLLLLKDIEVSLPKGNESVKKYNGVNCWYWLLPSAFGVNFCNVASYDSTGYTNASSVGGCAPMFRVKE
jgi:hypothetical protein